MPTHACKQSIFSRPVTNLLSLLSVLVKIVLYTNPRKKKRHKVFKFRTWSFSTGSERVNFQRQMCRNSVVWSSWLPLPFVVCQRKHLPKSCFLSVLSTSLSLAGNQDHLTWVSTTAARAALHSFLPVYAVFSCPNTGIIWQPGFVICNVCTSVDQCNCTRGLYGHR